MDPITDLEKRIAELEAELAQLKQQKQAGPEEVEAQRVNEQLRNIVEVSPTPLIITRAEGGEILFVNEPLARLVRSTPAELLGKSSVDFYADPVQRQEVVRLLERDGHLKDHEVLLRRVDGSTLWTAFSINIADLGADRVILGGIYDIDERKRAEEALRWERNFVSAILETAGALVTVLDTEGHIVIFNRACQETTGYSASEVVGKPFGELFIVPEERNAVQGVFQRLQAGDFPSTFENYWLTKQGKRRRISWTNSVLKDDEDQVEYVISSGIDITDHLQAQQKLQLYRQVIMNTSDGVTLLDEQGRMKDRNPAHRRITGVPDDEIMGKPMFRLIEMDRKQDILDAMGRHEAFRDEVTFASRDGERRSIDLSVFPIKDDEGEFLGYASMGRDITQRLQILEDLEQANRDLRQKQSQLVQSEKMASLGMLVAGIAHEINTPIGAVNSSHNTLVLAVAKLKKLMAKDFSEQVADNRKLQRILKILDDANDVVASGTERVTTIVRRLRSFARLDEAELKQVDIHEGIEDTLAIIHHEVKHRATLVKDYGDLPEIPVFAGPLNQVFLNLLMNASQALGEKGEIRITTRADGDTVRVEIQDNGCGMDEETQRRIFDPGFTTKGVGVGTGLGLSICYQIMQDHRGEISVDSEVGVGTTFSVVLPVNLDELLGLKI